MKMKSLKLVMLTFFFVFSSVAFAGPHQLHEFVAQAPARFGTKQTYRMALHKAAKRALVRGYSYIIVVKERSYRVPVRSGFHGHRRASVPETHLWVRFVNRPRRGALDATRIATRNR